MKRLRKICRMAILTCSMMLVTCGESADGDDRDTDSDLGTPGNGDSSDDSTASGGTDSDTPGNGGAGENTDTDDGLPQPVRFCPPLEEPTGRVISVTPDRTGELPTLVSGAQSGDVIQLSDGLYALSGLSLWFRTPGVTLRSASGDPASVILDGGYEGGSILNVNTSDVTIAEITVRRAFHHPIHVTSSATAHTVNTRIYRVHVVDPREQAIKINPNPGGWFADNGEIACSTLRLTDAGRPHVNPTSGGCYTGGVDAHRATGWVIRDNHIEGFWCPAGLAEHGVHMWTGSRDTVVERNVFRDNARGVGFGMRSSGDARTYDDAPCATTAYVGHYGGIIRNNFIFATDPNLFRSADGVDCGICLWSACAAQVVHNSIVATGDSFSGIEWRFAGSVDNLIANNIVTHPLRPRDNAQALLLSNLETAPLDLFVDAPQGDLHLRVVATTAIGQGTPLDAGVCDDDIDGDRRSATPDIGADEFTGNAR